MTNAKITPWFSGNRYIVLPDFVMVAQMEGQITPPVVCLALYLCRSADMETGEIIGHGITYISDKTRFSTSTVQAGLKALEKIGFLLRDSGAQGRILNRYKLFRDGELYDTNYIFTLESKATNKAAIQGKGKKAGTKATPMPSKQVQSNEPMFLNFEYCEEVLQHMFLPDISGFTGVCVPDPTNETLKLISVDKSEFEELKDKADLYGHPFPFKFEPGAKWTASQINYPGYGRPKQA